VSLKLVPYNDILIRDLSSIKDMLHQADLTEFIDNGRAKIIDYEKFIYIKYNEKYIGYLYPRTLHIGEICWLSQYSNDNPEEYMVITPMFVVPEYRSVGVGRNALKLYFKDRKGLIWIEEDNFASKKMVEYAGFVHYADGYYVKSL